jgi:hypothetical protein
MDTEIVSANKHTDQSNQKFESSLSVSHFCYLLSLSSLSVSLLSYSHTHSLFHSLSLSLFLSLCLCLCLGLSPFTPLSRVPATDTRNYYYYYYIYLLYVYISWLRVTLATSREPAFKAKLMLPNTQQGMLMRVERLEKATLDGVRMPSAEASSLTVIVN